MFYMAEKEELLTYHLKINWHCQKDLKELEQLVEEQWLLFSEPALLFKMQVHVFLL